MGSDKRERQKDNRRARLEAEADAWRRQQRKRRFLVFGIAAAVLVAVIVITNLFGEDDEEAATTDTSTTLGLDSSSSLPATPGPAPTTPPPGASITGETPCPEADGSSERTTTFENPPPTCIDEGIQYDAVVTTDVGTFTIALDAEAAPGTVNNFVVLARYHYFDGVPFHRVIPGFVVQGGDAVGNPPGTGGPGYTFGDELPASVDDYVEGSVAMANSGPDTNGSQFFVWLGPNPLPAPDYSLFGQVTDGLDVVQAIEADGTDGGTPAVTHVMQTVEIVERGAGDGGTTTTAP